MPSFSYRIKSKEDKQVSIYVSFRPQNSKSVFSRTGFTIHPSMWSSAKKRAKPVSAESKNLINKLTELEIFLGDQIPNNINLYDIDEVKVLRTPFETERYGFRGSSGVIEITLKVN